MNTDRHAVLLGLVAIFLLTVMDSVIKGLSTSYNAFQIMAFRQGFGIFAALGIFLWFRPGWPTLEQFKRHALRSLIMMATGLMFFHALGKMPIAELFVYTFTAPMFVALFGAIILKERVTRPVIIGLVLGFSGILLIVLTDPNAKFGGGSIDGLLAAVFSPVTYALAMVLLRQQAGSEPVPRIVFMQSLITASIIVPFVAPVTIFPTGNNLWMALSIALLGTAGNFILALAFSKAEAGKVIVTEYTGLIWAAIIGFLIFQETPRAMVWAGAILVVGGCFAVANAGKKSELAKKS